MFSWEYNEKMLKLYFNKHAEDMGRLCAELLYTTPKAYSDFFVGFTKAVMEKENVSAERRRPSEEGSDTDGAK
jgi:translation initiation factor 2 alpha subunit (eIF-2alpha)